MAIQHVIPLHVAPNSHILVMDWDFRAGEYFLKSAQRKNVSFSKVKGRNVKGKRRKKNNKNKQKKKEPKQTVLTNCPQVLWEGSSFTHPQGICFAAGKAHYLL